MYFKQNSVVKVRAGIIPLKTPKDYYYHIITSKEKNDNDFLIKENFIQFEKELINIFKNLFDEKIPFFTNDLE